MSIRVLPVVLPLVGLLASVGVRDASACDYGPAAVAVMGGCGPATVVAAPVSVGYGAGCGVSAFGGYGYGVSAVAPVGVGYGAMAMAPIGVGAYGVSAVAPIGVGGYGVGGYGVGRSVAIARVRRGPFGGFRSKAVVRTRGFGF